MTEGKTGEMPAGATEADRATEDASTDRPEGGQSEHRVPDWLLAQWRFILFVVILAIAAIAGFHYKSLADPSAEPPRFRSTAPQYFHLYFNSDLISDHMTIYLDKDHKLNSQGYTDFAQDIIVDVTYAHPVSRPIVVITSSSKPIKSPHPGPSPIPNFTRTRSHFERYAVASPLTYLGRNSKGQARYFAIESFQAIPVIFEDNGTIYGHLPSASILPSTSRYIPTVLAEFAPKTGKILTAQPGWGSYECAGRQRVLSRRAERRALSRRADWKCFSQQLSVPATERLENVGSELNGEQIDYMNPSTAVNNFDYVWQSTVCCNLEPVFKLTDPTAADSQSKAAFTSGIAFGVAGAALIAVLQELPKELPWLRRKRRRKASPQDA